MSIGRLQSESDLARFVAEVIGRHGVISFHKITGRTTNAQLPLTRTYTERSADPAAPDSGVTVYCIADNGAGKRELRARFPTGSPQAISTEP